MGVTADRKQQKTSGSDLEDVFSLNPSKCIFVEIHKLVLKYLWKWKGRP